MFQHHKWMDRAACQGAPTEVFFPERNGGNPEDDWAEARKYCAECEVRKPCLDLVASFETPDVRRNGMWAGMTPAERDRFFDKNK